MKYVFKHQKLTNISIFYQLQVVGRGSKTQLEVGENLICILDSNLAV